MEPLVISLLVVSLLLLVLGVISSFLGSGKKTLKEESTSHGNDEEEQPVAMSSRSTRRATGSRMRQRRGSRTAEVAARDEDREVPDAMGGEGEEGGEVDEAEEEGDQEARSRHSSKKEAKRREKEAKKQAEEAAREARMSKADKYAEKQRQKEEEREEEERKKAQELAEFEARREAEAAAELDKWKDLFTVADEGSGEVDAQEESQGLLSEFVDYIKRHKCVALEDLAADFGLRTQDAVNRVIALEQMGRISGVMDDRGKFIFISPEEMSAVADFIRREGRVSIARLAAMSNEFIDLEPKKEEEVEIPRNEEMPVELSVGA